MLSRSFLLIDLIPEYSEPIQKDVESEESVVIRCLAPESMLRVPDVEA